MNEYDIGNNIRERRKVLGDTQGDVAERMGVSKSQISKWENENSFPSVGNFIRLSEELNITPEALLSGRINEDFIQNKKQKEKGQKILVIVLCVLAILLCVTFVGELYLKFFHFRDKEKYRREILFVQQIENSSWEIRQMIQSSDKKVWIDVVIYQEENKITDADILEIICASDIEVLDYEIGINEIGDKLIVHIYYRKEDVVSAAFIEVENYIVY